MGVAFDVSSAAFRRLCVEAGVVNLLERMGLQPPSGGCVLKRYTRRRKHSDMASRLQAAVCWNSQILHHRNRFVPAAFRRLCVETEQATLIKVSEKAAAFRRLCVETWFKTTASENSDQPPSGGCVLKHLSNSSTSNTNFAFGSRLQAAVCWNISSGVSALAVCWNAFSLEHACEMASSRLRTTVCWNL